MVREEARSVVLNLRLLAKFLGFLEFLPYQTSEHLPENVLACQIALRSKVEQFVGDEVCGIGMICINRQTNQRAKNLLFFFIVSQEIKMNSTYPLKLCEPIQSLKHYFLGIWLTHY